MVTLDIPSPERLESVNDVTVEQFPQFAHARRHRDPPRIADVSAATRAAVGDIPAFDDLEAGAEVAITAGSRGIHDMPELLEATVAELDERGFDPFVIPAMGSHGGATPEGQREVLASYDITEERLGCEIRAAMDTDMVTEDDEGWPVPVSTVALDADAVLLANRVKLHTDFRGDVESGLTKMAVVGLGKQRGAEVMHNEALNRDLGTVIPERAGIIFEKAPVVGGIALVENANDRAAIIEGVPVEDIPKQESELLDRSRELFPDLPVDRLDLLVVDKIGKDISGTGLDTNTVGRYMFGDEPEPEVPDVTLIAVRGITKASHGNGIGMGLADFVHEDLVADLNLEDVYMNIVTSGEPARARIPIVAPCDRTLLVLAASMTGVRDPTDLRVGYIANTLEPDNLYVSDPVADELESREDVTVGERERLSFDEAGDFDFHFDDH
ncbi:nickel pincer cofactor-dependent isomerase, group 22 [Haladaptatus sp. NG-WS-4]